MTLASAVRAHLMEKYGKEATLEAPVFELKHGRSFIEVRHELTITGKRASEGRLELELRTDLLKKFKGAVSAKRTNLPGDTATFEVRHIEGVLQDDQLNKLHPDILRIAEALHKAATKKD